jgi:hypothetical protein
MNGACPHRRFAPGVAARHAPRCPVTVRSALRSLVAVMIGGGLLWPTYAGAAAAVAPGAYTGSAGQLTTSSATLAGSVNPKGQPTSYFFQYGLSPAYEAQTPTLFLGAGATSVHVSAPVTGLLPFTVYHVRLVAANSAGTVYGADRVFTTKKLPLKFATLELLPRPVTFARPFSVTGQLSGTEADGHAVVLEGNAFPYVGSFRPIAGPQTTDAAGGFTFTVRGLTENTALRVATGGMTPVHSPTRIQLVASRVALHVRSTSRRGFVRLLGTISPTQPGAHVTFQLLRPGRRPLAIGGTFLGGSAKAGSRFAKVVHIRRPGLYRAYVRGLGGAQVAGHSRAILIG